VAAPRVPSRAGVMVLAINASSQMLDFGMTLSRCHTLGWDAERGLTPYFTPFQGRSGKLSEQR
jgi:hypothetical protein